MSQYATSAIEDNPHHSLTDHHNVENDYTGGNHKNCDSHDSQVGLMRVT